MKFLYLSLSITLALSSLPIFAAEDPASKKRIDDLTKAIDKTPKDRFLLDERASLNYDMGNLQAAIDDCTKAIDAEPKDLRAYHLRSIAYKNLGKTTESKADADKLIELTGDMGNQNAGKLVEAAAAKIKANPKDSRAYSDRAAVYLDLKKYDASMADCNKAILLNKKNKAAYFTRMGDYLALHREMEAKADHAAYDKLNAGDVATFSKSAITDYTHALDLDPKNIAALRQRSQAYFEVGKYTEASEDLDKAIALTPNDPTLYRERAACFSKLKNQLKAKADLQKADSIR